MSRVERIEGQIKELTSEELQSLRAWFAEYDAQIWDRQFEFFSENLRRFLAGQPLCGVVSKTKGY